MSNNNNLLQEPAVVESVNGVLDITLTLEEATIQIGDGVTLRTRTFNGTVPGPTLVVSPGDTLQVKFVNLLQHHGIPYRHNALSAPDESNLHWHGLHVSGDAPSDDALLVIGPGESYDYTSILPNHHLPGTHWYHPHRHGSTTLQLGGGAAGAILVRDNEESTENLLPSVYTTDTRHVVMVVQPLQPQEMNEVADRSRDSLFQVQNDGSVLRDDQFRKMFLVNGQLQPKISLQAQEWIRLRIIHSQWDRSSLDITIPGCQMELIAKDGIYLPTLPRSITSAPILPAGRADIMVQCSQPSTVYNIFQGRSSNVLATLETDATIVSDPMDDLPVHVTSFPNYLQDLTSAPVDPSCSCPTTLGPRDNGGVNGVSFEYDHTTHYFQMDQVIERQIDAEDHPYHQHVYPFQLVSGFESNQGIDTTYYQLGDWHDTMEWEGSIRYQPTADFASDKIMLHCHRLDHEDRGMMGIERVADQCQCGAVLDRDSDDLSTGAMVGIAVGSLVVVVGLVLGVWKCCKSRHKSTNGDAAVEAPQD